MRNTLRLLAVTALAAVGVAVTAGTASAAPVAGGYDIPYPQCPTTPPSGQAWGVVGVNGGLATTANPCLAAQLQWAKQSTGTVASQPKVQLYLNTANPGQIRTQVSTWPKSGGTPYGTCTGGNTSACSWEYGWQRAQNSVTSIFAPAATRAGVNPSAAGYVWWLDVETANTWESGSSTALARNRQTLEGMTAYLTAAGGTVGLYSTAQQWKAIAGSVGTASPLRSLDSWLPGASTLAGASSNCAKAPLVAGGEVVLTQYVSGGLDHDVSCR
jgi:hypothetical protein